MSKQELLNNVDHKELRVITKYSAEFGDNLWHAPTFWREFRSVQAHYPILFQREPSGGYIPLVFFGFERGENLYLRDERWAASYIPLSVRRMPFYIGFQSSTDLANHDQQRVITVDVESPKVSKVEGERLFLEYGGNSDYLEEMANILETLHHGVQENAVFITELETCNLLEPVTIDVALPSGSRRQMIGFHTINEDALNSLPQDKIVELHQKGYLQAIYCVLFSQVKFNELAEKKVAIK